jgi:hypothetical protein
VKALSPWLYRPALLWWAKWSRFYRAKFQKKYAEVPLDKNLKLDKTLEALDLLTWKADSFKELGDACGSPNWPQHCVNELRAGRPQPPGALDCDDHGVWAASVLETRYKAELLSFVWGSDKKKISGHVVCLCHHAGKLFHIGNWRKSKRYSSLHELCADMMVQVKAESPVGWAVMDTDLNVKDWGLGLPSPTLKKLETKKDA